VTLESKFKVVRPNNNWEFSVKQDGNSTWDWKIDVPEVIKFNHI